MTTADESARADSSTTALVALKESDVRALCAEFGMSEPKLRAVHEYIAPRATVGELWLFLATAQRTGLDPFTAPRQIHAVWRWNPAMGRETMTIQTGIDGFRSVAAETGRFGGRIGPFWCARGGPWMDIWDDDQGPPWACKVGVYLLDHGDTPTWAACKWSEFSQTYKDRRDGRDRLMPLWAKMPSHQLAKCTEAQALRVLFPKQTEGLKLDMEVPHPDSPEAVQGRAQADRDANQPAPPRASSGRYHTRPDPARRGEPPVVEGTVTEAATEPVASTGEPTERPKRRHRQQAAADANRTGDLAADLPPQTAVLLRAVVAEHLPSPAPLSWEKDSKMRGARLREAYDRLRLFSFSESETAHLYRVLHFASTGTLTEARDAAGVVAGQWLVAIQTMSDETLTQLHDAARWLLAWSARETPGTEEGPA